MRNIFISIFILFSCNSSDKEQTIQAKYSSIIESVYASVEIQPQTVYYPQPTQAGTIFEILVDEGDSVKKGDILFTISPSSSADFRLENARINFEQSKSNFLGENNLLKNIQTEIKITKDQRILDSINFQRQEQLWLKKVGNKVEYDQAKLKFQQTNVKLKNLKLKYSQTKNNLENEFKKAKSNWETELDLNAEHAVRSKIDGKIYAIYKEEGDFIGTQERFAEVGSSDSFTLSMDIDEVDITKINLGDSILVILDAYNDKVFGATIQKIAPKKDELTYTFKVEGAFVETPPKLFSGLSGEANIIVSRKEKALIIPSEYLTANNKVKTNDGLKKVKTGVKNLKFVEILEGIDTTTLLERPIP